MSSSLWPRGLQYASVPVLYYLPEFAQTHVHWVCDAIQPSHSLSPPSPLALNLPSIRVFTNVSAHYIRWPKYWSFSFSISPSKQYSGFISFRIDWFDLFVQGTLTSLLQHHSLKASILQLSAFFMVPLWHLYMITGKTIALLTKVMLLGANKIICVQHKMPSVICSNVCQTVVNLESSSPLLHPTLFSEG